MGPPPRHRSSAEFTVPLCRGHHREVHRSGDEATWWGKAGIGPALNARALWLQTHPLLITSDAKPRLTANRMVLFAGKCQARTQIRFRGMIIQQRRTSRGAGTRAKEFAGPQKPTIEKDLSGFNAI